MPDSVRPHRWQPTRLPCSWDSPGKNTGAGCHFLLQRMKMKSESEVAQSCLTLATPWTAAHQAPPSMGFSRQKYCSGVPLPSLFKAYIYIKNSILVFCGDYQFTINAWIYFWVLCSVPLVYMSVFMLVPYSFGYDHFVIKFEVTFNILLLRM